MDEKTREALEGSIKKWENIAYNGAENQGSDDCALCDLYNTGHIPICSGCPIKLVAGNPYCIGTPYSKWINHQLYVHRNAHTVMCEKCVQIAEKEIDFLKSLRDD